MFSKCAGGIEAVLSFLLHVILLIMITSILAQVLGRYAVNHSPAWAEEVARMSIAWITMLGSAAVLRKDGHIAVTVVIDALPRQISKVVIFVRDCLVIVMAGSMVWYGYGFAVIGGRRASPALEIPMFYPFLAIPVGGALIALLMVLQLGEKATGKTAA